MPRFEQRLTTLEWVCIQASRLLARRSTDPASAIKAHRRGKLRQELRAFQAVRLDAIR
jgi:hypothetical protein